MSEKVQEEKNCIDVQRVAHELLLGKFLKKLICDYNDVDLSDGQIYALYQQCDNSSDFEEIIKTGAAESLR